MTKKRTTKLPAPRAKEKEVLQTEEDYWKRYDGYTSLTQKSLILNQWRQIFWSYLQDFPQGSRVEFAANMVVRCDVEKTRLDQIIAENNQKLDKK